MYKVQTWDLFIYEPSNPASLNIVYLDNALQISELLQVLHSQAISGAG